VEKLEHLLLERKITAEGFHDQCALMVSSMKPMYLKSKRLDLTLRRIEYMESRPWSWANVRHPKLEVTVDLQTPELESTRRNAYSECAVCLGEVRNPHINIACGHQACENCWSIIKRLKQRCPICREEVGNLTKIIPPNLVVEENLAAPEQTEGKTFINKFQKYVF